MSNHQMSPQFIAAIDQNMQPARDLLNTLIADYKAVTAAKPESGLTEVGVFISSTLNAVWGRQLGTADANASHLMADRTAVEKVVTVLALAVERLAAQETGS